MNIVTDIEQNSDEWLQARLAIPTASEFKKLITSAGKPSESLDDYAKVLAAEMFANKPIDTFTGNAYTERGHELESEARAAYEFLHDVDVNQVSYVTNDEETCLCSPDGLVGDDGLIEIKCCGAKQHITAIEYFHKNKKPPTDYIAQCQGQLMITERKWCDLMFYHPNLPELIIRITPDKDFTELLKKQIEAVLKERDRIFNIINTVQEAA